MFAAAATTLALTLGATDVRAQAAHSGHQGGADHAAIMAVVQKLFDGMRKGDSTMVRSVFAPNVRMITVAPRQGVMTASVTNGADSFAKAVGTPHTEVWDERIANEKVFVDGALASVWVDYAFFRGTTFSHCGVDHFLLTKSDAGAWTILELADTRRNTGCEQWTKK
ncbi:MAG: nuclear transport factor 2 family protein [Gemmatimonadaceae bacterium]|nr:nuclear transport factor 2 family protein [Gemmatimonadaceae bacterium]